MRSRLTVAADPDAEPAARPVTSWTWVALDSLRASDSPRLEGENSGHVRTLAELECLLPPILVHRETMRVIDGMHRLRAAELRGEKQIRVEFFEGDESETFALSVKLNITHGLRLSQVDRKAAAKRIIEAHPDWSDRRIAADSGLAASTVASVRRCSSGRDEQLNTRVGRDGRVRPLRATEGRLRASQVLAENPEASLRQVAEQAGIATATAKDVRDRMRQGEDPVRTRRHAEADQPLERVAVVSPVSEHHGSTGIASAPFGAALTSMRKDPALRTDAGRLLMHLLSVHPIGDEEKWECLVRSVPAHRADAVAEAARRCADHWLRLANGVESRRM
ncbi:ParB/RepB/Spo0J family partition protein [Streptomyces sp. PU-14G]|uniref:ParB/RepB/Spo0J family partition protein n=1 Tax=Streptomyces sp. PU-14G TaxID=2800808 RepID=UPI0034E03526